MPAARVAGTRARTRSGRWSPARWRAGHMRRHPRRGDGRLPAQHVEGRERPLVDAEPRAGIALRIEIDDQHPLADGCERRAEIDGGRGLADAALLIGEGDDPRAPRSECFMARSPRATKRRDLDDMRVRRGQTAMQVDREVPVSLRRLDLDFSFAALQEQPPGCWPEERAGESKRRGHGASARALTTSGVRLWALSARSSMRIA